MYDPPLQSMKTKKNTIPKELQKEYQIYQKSKTSNPSTPKFSINPNKAPSSPYLSLKIFFIINKKNIPLKKLIT